MSVQTHFALCAPTPLPATLLDLRDYTDYTSDPVCLSAEQ